MAKTTSYVAHETSADGTIPWTSTDNEVWNFLHDRQIEVIDERCCPEFIDGLEKLGLPSERVPQPDEVSKALMASTGWAVEPVDAVIPAKDFFELLANRRFPAASFIRTKDEIDYLQEPDIFHEIFGHCPLLTNQAYADFVETYGRLALEAKPKDRKYLFRLFWFTIEFGLIRNSEGDFRIYGGGILSSKEETIYALEKEKNNLVYQDFDVMTALRTPFRIDIVQPLYFVINSFDELYKILDNDLESMIEKARELGDFDPLFNPKTEDGNERYN